MGGKILLRNVNHYPLSDPLFAVNEYANLCRRNNPIFGSLRNDDGNGNPSDTNQWFDWLKEEK